MKLFTSGGDVAYELFQVCDDMATKLLTQYGIMCQPGQILEYKLLTSSNFVLMRKIPIANDFYYAQPDYITNPLLEISFFDISGRLYCIQLVTVLCEYESFQTKREALLKELLESLKTDEKTTKYNNVIDTLEQLMDYSKYDKGLDNFGKTKLQKIKALIDVVVTRLTQGDITYIPPYFFKQSNFYNHEQDQETQN